MDTGRPIEHLPSVSDEEQPVEADSADIVQVAESEEKPLRLPQDILANSIDPREHPRKGKEPQVTDSEPATFQLDGRGDDEEPQEPKSFERTASPAAKQRNKGATYSSVDDEGINRMQRFSLYETSSRFYLIGGDLMDKQFRVLKIDRTAPPGQLSIFEDDIVYDKREMNELLNAIDDGNKGTGGLKLKCSSWGLLGFIRFTEAYYMLLITKRSTVAIIGGHYVYQVDGTELVPLTTGSSSRFASNRNPEETRFLGILGNLDLSRSFYFSYSYNITRTLQLNIIREREAINRGLRHASHDFNEMFVWNSYLLRPAVKTLKSPYDWCLPIIHGFIDQASLDIFGRQVYITIIARRSRFFAGARFLKRGANDMGFVANDVETEQIVAEKLTTSFHAPGPRLYANPTYTSYVQHRGSIPLHWSQDNSGVTPKPDITVNLFDPFFSTAALHFDNLFERYGAPVYALNLIKARERTPRESKLLYEYQKAIKYLNLTLPEDKKIHYEAFDMSRASKTRGQDVIGTLEILAERVLQKTSFFHNGDGIDSEAKVQNGVARTNCIDCLDRTNAAQFVIGKRALGRQLQALGVISGSTVDYDSDCVNIFTHMFHDHGDTIAIQYGGSHLVNTMATYRKLNHWQSHSRDMVESFKRYYHNSFLDSQRQEAYNLFLGNYVFSHDQPMLWDLATDYYLHHMDPRTWGFEPRRSYVQWYTPGYLEEKKLPPAPLQVKPPTDQDVSYYDGFWQEYYRPLAISSFLKIFSFRMNSTTNYLPEKIDSQYDLSPFKPRRRAAETAPPIKKARKGVTIIDPNSDQDKDKKKSKDNEKFPEIRLQTPIEPSPVKHSILRDPHFELQPLASLGSSWPTDSTTSSNTPDKSLQHQWTLNQFHHSSLNPTITAAEQQEYDEYISHPLTLPLVVSNEVSDAYVNQDYVDYVNSASGDTELSSDQWEINDEDAARYAEFLEKNEHPLTVYEEDGGKKKYKAYRQWLRGKSLFKQSKVDPEYVAA